MKQKLEGMIKDTEFNDRREVGILFVVAKRHVSQTEIAKIIDTDKNTIRFFIDHLEDLGLLRRNKNPNNRKENLICLTESGKKRLQEISKILIEHERKVLYMFSDEDLEKFIALLTKFYRGIAKNDKNSH
ncbi:MarR family transcriptional regulator [Helicobacter sp. 10-6591]|uniref:MarR family winged helix-turn-helix transcriptional regulator n=1 Tax=Helicobacter sp. 10-6591 TaxID=2004998 RepID=UPI0015EB6D5B|nr:MarR family transcriptional regulator [Helicobacter sp. 10-6591]